MAPQVKGSYKNCFVLLLLIVFIGITGFYNSFTLPNVWLFNVTQHVQYFYKLIKIQTANQTLSTPSPPSTTNAPVTTKNWPTQRLDQETTKGSLPGLLFHEAYPKNYQFKIDEPNKCKVEQPFLVLMVPVAPQQLEARNAIRRTWGNESVVQGKSVTVVFMLGLPGGDRAEKQQEQLWSESQQHHDLIQSTFIDTYRNLTIKTLVIMDWLVTHCPQATYAMKVDSDMFLNLDNLMSLLLLPNTPKTSYMTGMIMQNRPVVREKWSKWYVPKEAYPDDFYPTYVLGMGYVFSNDLPKRIVEVSENITAFFVEDAYVGKCLKELGISPSPPHDPSQFKAYHGGEFKRNEFSQLITAILSSPQQLVTFWQNLKSPE